MQCPIGRAPYTMAFDSSVMSTLRGRPVGPRQRQDSTPQSADYVDKVFVSVYAITETNTTAAYLGPVTEGGSPCFE